MRLTPPPKPPLSAEMQADRKALAAEAAEYETLSEAVAELKAEIETARAEFQDDETRKLISIAEKSAETYSLILKEIHSQLIVIDEAIESQKTRESNQKCRPFRMIKR